MKLLDYIITKIEKLKWDRKHKQALKKYGRDMKCSKCDHWILTEGRGGYVGATDWHWIYQCDCGEEHAWFLGHMFPIYDDGNQGFPEWRDRRTVPINDRLYTKGI